MKRAAPKIIPSKPVRSLITLYKKPFYLLGWYLTKDRKRLTASQRTIKTKKRITSQSKNTDRNTLPTNESKRDPAPIRRRRPVLITNKPGYPSRQPTLILNPVIFDNSTAPLSGRSDTGRRSPPSAKRPIQERSRSKGQTG